MAAIRVSGSIVKIDELHYRFIPDSNLQPLTDYTINVTENVLAENDNGGCSPFAGTFTTKSLPFIVTSVDPINAKINVLPNKTIRIEFSNDVDLSTVDYSSVFLSRDTNNKMGFGSNIPPEDINPEINGKFGIGRNKEDPMPSPEINGSFGFGIKPIQNPNVDGEQLTITDRYLSDFPDNPNVDGEQLTITDRYTASESDNPNVDGEQLTITDEYI